MKTNLFIASVLIILFNSCSQAPSGKTDTNQINLTNETVTTNQTTVTNFVNQQNLKLKVYMGAASVGDLVSYGLDYTNSQLYFSNISLQYTWSSTYHQLVNGMNGFNIPVINVPAYFIEIPDKVLATAFRIYNNNESLPAIAVMTPNVIGSADDLTNIVGIYFQFNAGRRDSSDYTKSLYDINMGIISISSNSWIRYGKTNSGSIMEVQGSGQISYSNGFALSSWTEGGSNRSVTFTASGSTYVADMGINKGFSFGLTVCTNNITMSQITGKYLGMFLIQNRSSGHNTLDQNDVLPCYLILSNGSGGTNIDMYVSTNGDIDANYWNTSVPIALSNITGSDDGKLPACNYYTAGKNNNMNIVLVPSSDLSNFCLVENQGSPDNTNNSYFAGFGFFKRVQ